ncbi:uncharacterized protein LOC128998951 [Macrosteles quadrilineatus]|uniref:uncharacterized protein LOC128998951 n=1 Tax=Macrosteles quadrilineatus TaxID=74068 RepID=UPI0023E28C4A|nr:uncharacterized protein LOC128998951 [Macrosteles quadrilineatus]
MDDLRARLRETSWDAIVNDPGNINVVFANFLNFLVCTFECCFPTRVFRPKPVKRIPWFTTALAQVRERVVMLHGIYKTTNRDADKARYVEEKRRYRLECSATKKAICASRILEVPNQIKAAWEIIRIEIGKEGTNLACKIDPDILNSYFIDSVKEISEQCSASMEQAMILAANKGNRGLDVFKWSVVSNEVVEKLVMNFKASPSKDFYGFSNRMIREIPPDIMLTLTHLINRCLAEGIFPDVFKIARVIPVYKNGPRDSPSSYRPISLVLSKVLEAVMVHQLTLFLESGGLLSCQQFAYISGKLIVDAVCQFCTFVMDAMGNNEVVEGVFCNVSKAYDCVSHQLVLRKMESLGVSDQANRLVASFLKNRRQLVVADGRESGLERSRQVPKYALLMLESRSVSSVAST